MSSLLLVGFAQNFWVALAGRILGGALNGNIGVIQTMCVFFPYDWLACRMLTCIFFQGRRVGQEART
jgi:hypothetical protein